MGTNDDDWDWDWDDEAEEEAEENDGSNEVDEETGDTVSRDTPDAEPEPLPTK